MKIHVLRGLTAYYIKKGSSWVVESDGQKTAYRTFELMIESHPSLLELPVMQAAKERRGRQKFKPSKVKKAKNIPQRPVDIRTEKIVSCYYCSGKGELFQGVICPNCHGQKEILVTSVGFG